MKILIIGGVSAGASAAIAARGNSEEAEIIIYDRDVDIAHSAYATHYVIGGVVEDLDKLTPKSCEWFKRRHNIDVYNQHEISSIDHKNKTVHGINLVTKEAFQDDYDQLIFATGSSAAVPPVFRDQKFTNVFTVKNVQGGRDLEACIKRIQPKNVVVVGGGYIGLGVSEQLTNIGMNVTTLEFLDYPMAQLDPEISVHIADILKENGVEFYGSDGVTELVSEGGELKKVITGQGREYAADLFIVATGVRPNTELAESIGVKLGGSRAIKVNEKLETNIEDIYAIGDVAEAFHAITKEPIYLPLATTAIKMGQAVGDLLTGGSARFNGILGTSVVRLFGQSIAATGLTEKAARAKGFDVVVSTNSNLSRLRFMGGEDILIKAIADRKNEEILGVQMIGAEGVDRLIDVFATAMTFRAKVSDLPQLDLVFTPPISTPVDPVMSTGTNLFNAIHGEPLITPEELIKKNDHYLLIDLRSEKEYALNHINGAQNLPIDDFRNNLDQLTQKETIIVYSASGKNGHIAQKILLNKGFKNVFNLSGGIANYSTLYRERLTKE